MPISTNSGSSDPFEGLPLRDDNPSSTDLLGFGDIVIAVESTVMRSDLDPITVGINAPWGGGKTTVLQLLKERLANRNDALAVYVSPWEFDETTDTKAAVIGAVLGRLEEEVSANQSGADAILEKLEELKSRVNVAKAIKLTAASTLTMSLPSFDALAGIFAEPDSPGGPTLQGFREQFGELLSSSDLSDVAQVVVLVDDLDRSLPDTVVETLEAIKLFLSVEKMAFVIAADEDNVARAIGQRLESTGQPQTARQYLEKIVHIPFRIPALSRERTSEYLALLLLADTSGIDSLVERVTTTRGSTDSLAARLGPELPDDRRPDVELAERLAPILHRHTTGNPRRLKRFLNAIWLRTALASARGLDLEVEACAKLMIAELLYPNLFADMLGWLATGSLETRIEEIECGEEGYAEQVREWGQLEPPLRDVALSEYLLLAAALRGETVEAAVLPPDLQEVADKLMDSSDTVRTSSIQEARQLTQSHQAILARYIATQLRHQHDPDRQFHLGEAVSGIAATDVVASSAAAELQAMDPASVLPPLPIALLSRSQPAAFVALVRDWAQSDGLADHARRAAAEALNTEV